MAAFINTRIIACLAAASAVALSLAPATAAAPPSGRHHHAGRHFGLCDGHKWSLFGCRPDAGHAAGADQDS